MSDKKKLWKIFVSTEFYLAAYVTPFAAASVGDGKIWKFSSLALPSWLLKVPNNTYSFIHRLEFHPVDTIQAWNKRDLVTTPIPQIPARGYGDKALVLNM